MWISGGGGRGWGEDSNRKSSEVRYSTVSYPAEIIKQTRGFIIAPQNKDPEDKPLSDPMSSGHERIYFLVE